MAPPLSQRPHGRSGNHSDYQAAFLQHVHRLLQLGYESLVPADYEHSEEDDITGDLCKHMRHLTEMAPTERWMARFSIHDQDPGNDVPSVKTGLPRKGKRRPKIDIRIVCKHRVPNRGYCIEAKRLYRGDSVSEYANDEGVGAFICGDYASNDGCGGMIGYVQTGEVVDWINKLEAKLGSYPHVVRQTDGSTRSSVSFKSGPELCFSSRHRRDSGDTIELIHVMLVLRAG